MAPGATLAMYGRVGNSTSEISISDFYRQAWNARIVGFISPVPEETKGEDLATLAGLVADGRLRPRIGLELDWRKTAQAFAALTPIMTSSGRSGSGCLLARRVLNRRTGNPRLMPP